MMCFSVWSMILVTFQLLISRLIVLCEMTLFRCWRNISSNLFMKVLFKSVPMVFPTTLGRSGLYRLGMDLFRAMLF